MVIRSALFFTGSNCAACKKMHPVIDQLKQEKFNIEQIDVNQKTDMAKKYSITALPTIVILQANKEVDRFVGITSIEKLRESMKPKNPDYIIW